MIYGLRIDLPAKLLQELLYKAADHWIAEADVYMRLGKKMRATNLAAAAANMRVVADHLALTETGLDSNDPMAGLAAIMPTLMGSLKTSLASLNEGPDLKSVKTPAAVRELRPGGTGDVSPPQAHDPLQREAVYRLYAAELAWLNEPPPGDGPFYPFAVPYDTTSGNRSGT